MKGSGHLVRKGVFSSLGSVSKMARSRCDDCDGSLVETLYSVTRRRSVYYS